jgi:hypothetical protein
MSTITSFLNSYQSDFSYINLLGAADLSAAGAAYALPGSISTTQISVASYGALGDGTDQTAKIQAALNGASGKTLYFPAGTYIVSSTLTIPPNTRLLGDNVLQNTVIKASSSLPAGSALFQSAGNNTYIQKIIIDGNNNQNRTVALLSFYNVRYVYLIQSIVQNTSHMGMAAGGCLDVRVWGCKFENCGRPTYSSAIGSTPAFWTDTTNSIVSKDVYLEKNLFLNNNWSAAYLMPTGGYFKDNLLVNNGESGVFSNQNARFVVYQNNYIYGQTRKNISASGLEIGGDNHSIINNVIHGCGNDGISLSDVAYSLVEYNSTYDNGVENSYPAFALAAGISLSSLTNGATNARYNTIRYNRSYNSPLNSTQQIGIMAYRAPGASEIDYSTIGDNANYNNVQYQFRNHQNNSLGGYNTIGDNLVDPNSLNVGHRFISATVQNIFNTSLKTFSITASPTTGEPNTVVTYTINTTLIPNGIILYLKETGSPTSSDFEWVEKQVVINNNSATVTRRIGNINATKTSTLSLREGSIGGPSRATVTVNLTLSNKRYEVWPFSSAIGEGKSITFTVNTTNVSSGTVLYYSIEGTVSSSDFVDNTLLGQVTIGNSGRGYITKVLTLDNISDNNETISLKLFLDSNRSAVVASTNSYIIKTKDQNATYTLSASTTNVVTEQNKNITFTLSTQNIPPGSNVAYEITGISSNDLVDSPPLTGNITINDPTPTYSNYNDLGGWVFYPRRFIDGDETDVFIRGDKVIVSEEVLWSGIVVNGVWTSTGPSGSVLLRVSNKYKARGYKTGLSITPYSTTHRYLAASQTIEYGVPATTYAQLINEINNSQVDFVQLNPHLFSFNDPLRLYNGNMYWDETGLLTFVNGIKSAIASSGKELHIVLQGWRQTDQTFTEVQDYNNKLLALTGVDEFYVFGQEDALDLTNTVSMQNDFLPDTIISSKTYTTYPDSLTEGLETFTFSLLGPAVDLDGTLLPFTGSDVISASVDIFDSSIAPVPTYTLTRSSATVNEGQSVTITLTTTNVANGTTLPWTVTGITSGDLSSGSLTGNFVVGSVNTASFTFSNDVLTDGQEIFTLALDNGAASIFVVVEDTSTAPVVTYSISNNAPDNKINEGQVVTFTLTTTNVPAGTIIPWDVVGIDADDLLFSFVTGQFTVGTVDTATFTLKNDQAPEGTEVILLRAYYPTISRNNIVASSSVNVIDTSFSATTPSYVLTNDSTAPSSEGDYVTFLLTTTNVSPGTIVPWQIIGLGGAGSATSANDFLSVTEGSFLIDGNGVSSFAIGIKSDLKTENTEGFRLRLKNNIAIYNDVYIADTSSSSSVYALDTNLDPVSEGQDFIVYLTQTPYDASENTQSYAVTGITSSDLDLTLGAASTGSFNLTDVGGIGLASVKFRIKADTLTEGPENFILTLNGIGRSESITIGVTDSSTTPGVSYTLNSTTDTVNESGTVTFHLSTTGVGASQNVPYTVSGITLADLSLGALTGNFTTNAVGGGSVTFVIDNDFKAEGTETLTLSLNNGQASKSVSIIDTSVPSYSLSSAGIVNEGSSITITITGAGTQSGDVVPYFITGLSTADLDSTSLNGLTGNFIIDPTGTTPNQGTITLTLANDLLTEGPETFVVNIGTVDLIYTSHSIIVTDSSLTPPTFPGYNLQVLDYVVDEGDTLTFVLYTTNIPATTNVPYTITGITAADLLSGSITGNFVAGSYATDEARLTITLKADTLTEGPETLRLAIDGTNQYVDVVVRDTSLTPSPTTPTYSLSVTPSSLYEGSSVFVLLSVTNLGAGVNVPYIITGVSSEDIDKPLSGGTFVVNSAGKASIVINATSDLLTEGTENLILTLKPISGASSSVNIPIIDTSTSFPSYNLSANATIYNEGDTAYILLTTTGLPVNTSIPYTIFGVGPNDINNASLTGNFVTNVTGFANLTLTLTPDGVLEAPQEFLNVSLNANSQVYVTVYINDTSKPAISYNLTSNTSVASENSTVNITLNTTGIFQNTLVPYVIGGTIGEDDYTLDASGNFVIDPLGNSVISITILKDYILENTEVFFLYLQDNPQTNITIYVNDFAYSTTVPLNFVEYVPPPPPITTPPPGFNVTEITSLGDALDRPSTLVQNLIPEFSRGG